MRFYIAHAFRADRRGNGQIDRVCDALALDALVKQGQSEPSLQLNLGSDRIPPFNDKLFVEMPFDIAVDSNGEVSILPPQ